MAKYYSNQNIQPLNDAGQRALDLQRRTIEHQRKVHRKRRIICASAILVLTLIFTWQYQTRYQRYVSAEQTVTKTKASLSKAQDTNRSLKQTKKDVQNNDYLGKLARQRYLYSKDGEVVFNLPDDN
ncbi:septum formation initiator family protein [Weissella viridescens]|uniref:Septum formation initiator family protein n=1 Tax=Weissella viridescens TaxID=1629 RepID=A0A3P2RCF5_WEIVI|nr:septum formation initiator family protein [Weissella viridescens]RRG17456.1 septum formation initiator family protein [Weissella viridescens]